MMSGRSEEDGAVLTRSMGCRVDELLRWLPMAFPDAQIRIAPAVGAGHGEIRFAEGTLRVDWTEQAPLQIALLTLPRLCVRFDYQGMPAAAGAARQAHFDRVTHRGGG